MRSQSPGLLLSAAIWVPTAFAIVVIWVSAATVRPWGRGPGWRWPSSPPSCRWAWRSAGSWPRTPAPPSPPEVGTVETLYIVGYLLAALAFVGLLAKVRQRPEPISAVDSALVFAVIVTIGYVAVLQPLARRDIQVGLALETLFLLVDALLAALIVRLWLSSSARFNRALRTMLVAVAIFVVDDMVATYFTVNTTVRAEWEGSSWVSSCSRCAWRQRRGATPPSSTTRRAACMPAGSRCCARARRPARRARRRRSGRG